MGYRIDLALTKQEITPHAQYAIRDAMEAHPDVIVGSTTRDLVWWDISPPGPRARAFKKLIERMIVEGLQ